MPKSLGKRPRSRKAKEPRGSTCPHGKVKGGYYCKECPGKGICEHGRRRSTCKECGGSSICEHGRVRSKCKECGGSSICEHGRQRYGCKECGGSGICEHGRQRHRCNECRSARAAATRVLCPPVHPKPEILVECEDVEDPGEEV
jgi:hypothetical protein